MILSKESSKIVDGEIVEYESSLIKKISAESFIQVYLEDMSGLMNICSYSEYKVLAYLWKNSMYYPEGSKDFGNRVMLSKYDIESLSSLVSVSTGSIRNIITSLTKKNLLLKRSGYRGNYYLNPMYFFKGQMTDRLKSLKFNIEYVCE